MSRIDERIEDYRSRLHPDDRDEFDREYDLAFNNLDEDAIYDELDTQYGREDDHLELVTAVASAFHHQPIADGYESGYRFAFTEPLEEQNSEVVGEEEVKNGDVLLAKRDDGDVYICIVECKAGTAAGRDWVRKLEQIEEVINTDEYRDILLDQLGADEIRHEQYVVLGKLAQIVSMDYGQIDDDLDIPPNYAFWGYDLGDQEIVKVHGNVQDGSLASVVNDSMDAGKVENPIEFTFGDHTLIKFKAMVETIINGQRQDGVTHPFEFNRSDFYRIFNDELQVGFTGDIRNELVTDEVNNLLLTGKEIGLFTSHTDRLNTSRDYRILFQGKTVNAAKQAAENKYLGHKTEEKHRERAFDDVREHFQPEQTRLSERDWEPDDDEAAQT